jgi:Ca-activated chloride channel family protein
MSRLHCCLGAAAALILAAVPAGHGRARAAEGALVVIFDGSGSMWGAVGNSRQTKVVMAREALRRGLGKLAPDARVGLVLFGHRRGACTDPEVVQPPEPLDVSKLMAPLDQLDPRGRGPITLAVREAAKSLPADAKPRTLLLIHDDADNCQPDLCTAAAELQAAGITAHVVGLGVKTEDMAKMTCLSQATGGRHFNAQTGEQVAGYIEEALLLAASAMGGVQTAAVSPAAAIVPPAPVPASGPPALYLRAVLAPNTEPVNRTLYWTVTAEARPGVPIFGEQAVSPTVPVEPGRYTIEVQDGAVSAKRQVEVRDNRPASVTMTLNAGTLRVRALDRKSGDLLPDALITATDANGALLAVSKGGEAVITVPAGRHVVRAELGTVRSEQTVTVAAGRLFAVDVPLNVARLEVSTAGRDGQFALEAPVFQVLEDDPDAPDGLREVARSAAQPAVFVLPPGTYYALARQGAVEVRDRLALGPGETMRHTLAATAGRLALSTSAPSFGGKTQAHISYRVARIDNVAQEDIVTSRPSPTLLLPTGRYRVEGRYGLINVRTVREVEVKAGETLQVSFAHQAAGLRLRATGSGPADVSWVLRDQTGRTVWTGAHPDALTVLQAGRYTVHAETRAKRVELSVDLRAGENKLLEVPLD